jgi:hypothetical protein
MQSPSKKPQTIVDKILHRKFRNFIALLWSSKVAIVLHFKYLHYASRFWPFKYCPAFLHTCMVVLTDNLPNVSVKNLTFCRRITYFVAKSCWILILTNYTSIQATTMVILLMFYFYSENVVTFIPHQICLNFVCKYCVRDNRVISASRILSPAWQKWSVSYIYLLSIWLKSHVSFAPLYWYFAPSEIWRDPTTGHMRVTLNVMTFVDYH